MPTPNKSRYGVSAVLPVAIDRQHRKTTVIFTNINYSISVLYIVHFQLSG